MYILVNPINTEKSEGTPDNVDWEFGQKEIAQAKGFATGFGSGLSKGTFIEGAVSRGFSSFLVKTLQKVFVGSFTMYNIVSPYRRRNSNPC